MTLDEYQRMGRVLREAKRDGSVSSWFFGFQYSEAPERSARLKVTTLKERMQIGSSSLIPIHEYVMAPALSMPYLILIGHFGRNHR